MRPGQVLAIYIKRVRYQNSSINSICNIHVFVTRKDSQLMITIQKGAV